MVATQTDSGAAERGRQKRRETAARWYQANREKQLAYSAQYRAQNPDVIRAQRVRARDSGRWKVLHLRREYGLTVEQFESMLHAQEGRCDVCGVEMSTMPSGPCVDHDHKTGRVRSLLCSHCNSALGLLQDDPDILDRAAAYLRRHKGLSVATEDHT